MKMRVIRNRTFRVVLKSLGLFFLCLFGSIGFGHIVGKIPLIVAFDRYFYHLSQIFPHTVFLQWVVDFFNFGNLPYFEHWPTFIPIMVLLMLIFSFINNKKIFFGLLLALIIGSIVTFIVTLADWDYVVRERPFITLFNVGDTFAKSVWKGWTSYPSGHARETTLYITIFIHYFPKFKWFGIGFIVFIALSRLYLGAHFPTDILAGIAIGWIGARIGIMLSGELYAGIGKKNKT